MLKRLFPMMFLILSNYLVAQRVNQCGIIVPPESPIADFQSVYEAGEYVNTMLDSINWRENFRLREQNGIYNAYATIIRNIRYIVYDNNFLESLDSYAGTRWASLSVLAHEMGHHYRNHVVDGSGSTPPKELEADYFSGYVMGKIGASLQEAKAAMEKIASPQASRTHPARSDRLSAITKGWNYAKGIGDTQNNPPPAPQPQENPPPPSNGETWIHLSLYGNTDMTVYLSDNGKDYSPVQLNATQPFVFKFEVYNYGWLRLNPGNNSKTYKLLHGHDYAIVWSRRSNGWTVIPVP